MSSAPKHSRISQELLAEIAAGKYAPSGRLPSEAQLVERFGCPRPTVAPRLARPPGSGAGRASRRVGQLRPWPGRRPRSTASSGSLIPGLGTTEIFEVICGELAGLARVHGYGLLWGGRPPPPAGGHRRRGRRGPLRPVHQQPGGGRLLRPVRAHGPPRGGQSRAWSRSCIGRACAVVLLDRDLGAFPSRSEFDLVGRGQLRRRLPAGRPPPEARVPQPGLRRAPATRRSTVNARIAGAARRSSTGA